MPELDLERVLHGLKTGFIGRSLVYRPSVASTMDLARQEAETGAPEGTVVLADAQTAGRGRYGRVFISPAGVNLYPSIVLRPETEHLRWTGIIAALAVARATEEVTGLHPRIKWPNDVLLERKKYCGILVETDFTGTRPQYSIVGIGVDVNVDVSDYEEIAEIATSPAMLLGHPVSREDLLAALLNHLERLYLQVRRGESVLDEWRARMDTLGKEIRARTPHTVEEGTAEDVDADGNLILRRADGSTVTIIAGEVTLRA